MLYGLHVLKETVEDVTAGLRFVVFVLMARNGEEDHFHFIVYYVAILFLALYLGAIAFTERQALLFSALFYALAVVSIEAAVNTAVTSVTKPADGYTDDNAAAEKLVDSVQPNDFLRMEKVTRKTRRWSWMHFPSVSCFLTANADLSALFKKLGCESSRMLTASRKHTLVDACFP